jgi:uncharacterized lipoprotein YddW (UPF0748 family)
MKWRILFVLTTLMLSAKLFAADNQKVSPAEIFPPPPAREFRGAWLATVANIDWPSKPGLPVARQKAELISLLDRAAQLKFNAVLFQVRPVCDAFYASPLEPWSEYLTGTQGRAPEPFYDPLALAIAEAHKRGLELHAWFNPFRAAHPESKSPPAPSHITRTHPELVRRYGKQTVLDPGEPAVQARVIAVVQDVVKRYDVDGIVFDDYFYPYPEKKWTGKEMDFPDDATWKKFGAASGFNRDDWRRENVNRFIRQVSQTIKAAKPWVQFGISPFGIWRPQNPAQIKGMDAYAKIYADSRKWLANGWADYFAPQLYWPIATREQSFPMLFDWWRAQNSKSRHVWPALYDAMVGTKFSTDEIPRQVQITRGKSDPGAIHYHLRSVLENPALATAVRAQYSQPVLIPATPWLDSTPPEKPKLTVNDAKNSLNVRWENAGTEPARWWLFQSRTNAVWTTEIFPANQTSRVLENSSPDAISIRAVDRLGNLSAPTFWSPKKYSPSVSSKGAVLLKK